MGILKTRGEKASSEESAGRLDDEVSHEIDDGSHGENDYAVNKETDEEDDEETIEEIFEEAYEEGQDENGEGIHDESHDEEEEESHPESNDESDEESSSDTDEREDHGRIESCLRFNDFKIGKAPYTPER
ncbi:hypothetical protein SLS55_006974 [Diplodia seriata]|uniref:Uncharacterized protein n=1 Tax=Diplodia seriata TaxID=420778 RepID=A0ABR3CBA4_9PEZI